MMNQSKYFLYFLSFPTNNFIYMSQAVSAQEPPKKNLPIILLPLN